MIPVKADLIRHSNVDGMTDYFPARLSSALPKAGTTDNNGKLPVPNILVFTLSLFSTIVVSALLLWAGTKLIGGFKVKIETVFWVSFVTQVYRSVASLVLQYLAPRYPMAGFILVLCTVIYVQALALRLAIGVGHQEISLRKAHVISFLTTVICFVGILPLVAWLVKRISG